MDILNSKALWIIVLLSIIYFFGLRIISNFNGQLLYIIGYSVPMLMNFLIPYFIAFDVLKLKNLFLKLLYFIVISFVLGMNFNLLRIFDYQPSNLQINVMSPLHKPNSLSIGAIESPSRIKLVLLSTWLLQWDNNCQCGYFFEPVSMSYEVMNQFTHRMQKMIIKNTSFTQYTLDSNAILFDNYALYQLTITDNKNGSVQITAQYPTYLYMQITNRRAMTSDPYYWSRAVNAFFNDNFWQRLLINYFTVKTPLELLTPQQWDQLFTQDKQ